jgi:ribosome maturation factor RimP
MSQEQFTTFFEEAEHVAGKTGFLLVETTANRTKKGITVRAVLYRPEGITLGDCEKYYKALFPRLEMINETGADLYLEVASPGIDRVFKDNREFSVFAGRAVKILLSDSGSWVEGIIGKTDTDGVFLDMEQNSVHYEFQNIRKAKLDYKR